jgi:uroporphyrin-III C-methyltransferase/precorrin-2 dehydrogenase/sirohydrochlorin ferrochelatase/uroporphyrin-III C-methyltransferase
MNKEGFVSLVGAGPGDAELLTVKALRLIQQANVVVYDRLVSADILDLIPTGVSRIAVGKSPGNHCVPQSQINEIIINLAKAGRRIVRLKGGDPYMFGRGGEEVLALKQHNIKFEVVPGITAANGCSAYSGIPLTHRGLSRSVKYITGHFSENETLEYDWSKLADKDCTLVFYMALGNLQLICQQLNRAGLSASTPAAAIENGTTQAQRRVISTLSTLVDDVNAHQLHAPAMIIIGEVVSLADELDWFQSLQESADDDANMAAHR